GSWICFSAASISATVGTYPGIWSYRCACTFPEGGWIILERMSLSIPHRVSPSGRFWTKSTAARNRSLSAVERTPHAQGPHSMCTFRQRGRTIFMVSDCLYRSLVPEAQVKYAEPVREQQVSTRNMGTISTLFALFAVSCPISQGCVGF